MKKIILFSLILLGLLIISPVYAAEERIHNFEIEIKVNKDSSLDITEKILYDFETLERHGIYRDIPYKYQVHGKNFNLRLSNFSVYDELNNKLKFSVSTKGNNKRIQIGDKNKIIKGQHIYVINYTVNRAINFFDDHDELYWNSIGVGWDIPISNKTVFFMIISGFKGSY